MAKKSDEERLGILVEARVNQLEKDMKKAQSTLSTAYGGMKRDSKSATVAMEQDMLRGTARINQAIQTTSTKLGSMGKAMVAGFAGGLVAGGVTGIVSRLGQVASGIAQIGDEARRAGIDIKSFQELKYVAEQNRISVDALTDGMKELSLRADEWIVTGGGAAAEAFQRLGFTAEELNVKLQNPSALLTEIIGKVQSLDRAAQIRIFDELFGGTGGEQFVQLIGQGEEGIRRTIDEANNLGIVMDEQMIAKAAEVDRKFNMVANTVGSAVKGAIVEAAAALNDFLNSMGQTPGEAFGAINERIDEQVQLIHDLGAAGGREFPELAARLDEITTSVDRTGNGAVEAKVALLELARNPDYAPLIGDLNGVLSILIDLTGQAREAAAAIAAANSDPIGSGTTWDQLQGTFFPKPRTVPGSGRTGGSGRNSAADEAERQAKAVQNLIAGLEFERSLIGLSAVEQAKLTALRKVGAGATDQQRLYIEQLVESTYREQEAAEFAADSMERLGQAGTDAMNGLVDAFADGKLEADELLGIVTNLVKQLLTPMPGGSIFSALGSLFGGGMGTIGVGGVGIPSTGFVPGLTGPKLFARGGIAREPSIFGEAGPEAAVPLPDGRSIPVDLRMPAGGGGQSTVLIELSDGLVGSILQQAAGNTVQIVRASEPSTVEKATAASGRALASGDYRRGMASYGLQQQARRR